MKLKFDNIKKLVLKNKTQIDVVILLIIITIIIILYKQIMIVENFWPSFDLIISDMVAVTQAIGNSVAKAAATATTTTTTTTTTVPTTTTTTTTVPTTTTTTTPTTTQGSLLSFDGNWTQLGKDIDGEAINDMSGSSVSLSSDGKIVAIGSPYKNDKKGQVGVYQFNEVTKTWTQLGEDIDGEAESDRSGSSVSLSSDGKILAIGSYLKESRRGNVRIFKWNETKWNRLGFGIYGVTKEDMSGGSISLSSDGKIVVIGSPFYYYKRGLVRIFEFYNEAWTQLGENIVGEEEGDSLGRSVSLSNDGKILAIGSKIKDNTGKVKVYQFYNEAWTQLGENIVGEEEGDSLGRSVSLSNDGKILAIGSKIKDDNTGKVKVYQFNEVTKTWTQLGEDIDGIADRDESDGDESGYLVSLSSDGTIIAIGSSNNDDNKGRVIIYKYNGEKWIQLGEYIDGISNEYKSQISVSLSSDGKIVAIGSSNNDDNKGHVRVYKYNNAPPTTTTTVPITTTTSTTKPSLKVINDQNIKELVLDYYDQYNTSKKDKIISEYGKISDWDTSNVTDMFGLFQNQKEIDDISKWNTSKVKNMAIMFFSASNFNQDISTKIVNKGQYNEYIAWDTGNVTDMAAMLNGAEKFNQNIGNWNTSKVTNMSGMFSHTNKFNQDISTKQVNLKIKNYTAWNTDKVTNMEGMFDGAKKFNQNISNWNTSKVSNMSYMFNSSEEFNQNVLSWDLTSLKNATNMFLGAIAFNDKFTNYCPTFNYSIKCYIKPKYTTTTKPTTTQPTTTKPTTTKPVPTTTKPVPTTTKPIPTTTKPIPTTTKPIKKETKNGSWKYESNMSDSGEGGYALYVSPYSGHANIFLPATEFYNL